MHPELLNNSTFLRYYQQWQRNPESIVFAAIADYFLRYQMIEEANDICQHGLKRFPNLVSGRLILAKIFIAKQAWDEALTELHYVLSLQTEQAEALLLMKQIQRELRDFGPVETIVEAHEAIAEVSRGESSFAQEPIPEIIEPLPELAPVLEAKPEPILPKKLKMAREEEPIPDEDPGIDILPSRWKTLTMARILQTQGHSHKARQIYLAILARDPQNETAREALAALQVEATI